MLVCTNFNLFTFREDDSNVDIFLYQHYFPTTRMKSPPPSKSFFILVFGERHEM